MIDVDFCPRGYYIVDMLGVSQWCPVIGTVEIEMKNYPGDIQPKVVTYDDRHKRRENEELDLLRRDHYASS